MYSVYGGVQHHRSRVQFTAVAVLFLVVGTIVGLGRSGLAVSLGADDVKSAASHQTAPVEAPAQLPEPALAPIAPAGSDMPTKVTGALNSAIQRESSATWSIAVYDIANKQWLAQINADQQLPSASLYKLYAAYALSKSVPASQWSTKSVADQTVTSCVDRMLRLSDNTCGEAVGKMVGWGAIDRFDRAYGFSKTATNLPSGPITTANDTTTFMSDLYQSKLFDVSTTSSILDSLRHQIFRKGIPAGCTDCTVYNKTGTDPGLSHDAAIVSSGSATYAVTVLSRGGSPAAIARIEQTLQAALSQ